MNTIYNEIEDTKEEETVALKDGSLAFNIMLPTWLKWINELRERTPLFHEHFATKVCNNLSKEEIMAISERLQELFDFYIECALEGYRGTVTHHIIDEKSNGMNDVAFQIDIVNSIEEKKFYETHQRTSFGNFLRWNLMITRGISETKLASILGIKEHQLLELEYGLVDVPESLYQQIIQSFDLNQKEARQLRRNINDTMEEEFILKDDSENKFDNYCTCLRFFQDYDVLSIEEENKIFSMLSNHEGIEDIKLDLYDQFSNRNDEVVSVEQFQCHTTVSRELSELELEMMRREIEEEWECYFASLEQFAYLEYKPKIKYHICDFNEFGKSVQAIFILQFEKIEKVKVMH